MVDWRREQQARKRQRACGEREAKMKPESELPRRRGSPSAEKFRYLAA